LPQKMEPRSSMYKLLVNRFGHKAGTIVYDSRKYDFGLASDDYRLTGIEHTSVTLDPCGDYPVFTVPTHDLEIVE